MKRMIILFALSIFVLQSCSEGNSKDTKTQLAEYKTQRDDLNKKIEELEESLGETKEEKKVSVQVFKMQKTNFTKYVNMQSVVYSDKNSNLSAKLSGVITKINVEAGDFVQAGQVLIELDNSMQVRRLAEAKNRMEFIETVFKKQESIWNKKVGSEIDYLKAKNDFETMQKSIALIEEEIELLKLKAPFSGTVDMVMPKVGEALSPGMGAIVMSSNTNLEVRAEFPENYYSKIKKGDNAKVYFPDLDIDTLNLKVSNISETIDTKNRTMTAIIKIPNNLKDVKSNMTCVTKFATYHSDSAMVIPINIVQKENNKTFIYIAAKGKDGKNVSQKKYVTLGQDYNDKVEVLSGLSVDDMIITYGTNDVADQTLVEVSQVVANSNY